MKPIRFSERVFAVALRLLPRWFRNQYGEDMKQDFVDRSRMIGSRSGWVARVAFQIRSVLEVPGQSLRVRRKTPTASTSATARSRHFRIEPSYIEHREAGWRGRMGMGSWMKDLRITVRNLARRPGFALGVALTLGLGIGATTTIYTVVDGVMIRPLPYEEPSALVAVGALLPTAEWRDREANLQDLALISAPNFEDFRERARSFEKMTAIEKVDVFLNDVGDGPDMVAGARISPELFEILGVSPALGRTFFPEEYSVASENVAMLTYGAWQRRYGGDPGVLGRPAERHTPSMIIVGILPRDFRPPEAFFPSDEAPEFYRPLQSDDRLYQRRGTRRFLVLGRLTRSTSLERARAEAERIAADLASEFPEDNVQPDGSHLGIGLNDLHDQTVGTTGRALGIFLGAAGLLLLLAAMNAATLLLSRSLDRTRELGVRMALGAGRSRVVRLLVNEAAILSVVGGAFGVLVAYGGVGVFLRYAPSSIPRLSTVAVDTRVLAVAAVVSLGTGIAAGLLPALRLTRRAPWERLQSAGSTFAEPTSGLRAALVGGQMAVAVVLLSGAGLLFGSFVRIRAVDPGFEPEGLITMTENIQMLARVREVTAPTDGPRPSPIRAVWQGWDIVLDELGAVPGVESVAGVTNVPFQSPSWAPRLLLPGDAPDTWREGIAGYAITPGYLETMGTELLQGRQFERLDGPAAERVALVNESFVPTQLGGETPIGVTIRRSVGDEEILIRIVGVVEDVVQTRAEEGPRAAFYVPYTQYRGAVVVHAVVRTSLPNDVIIPELRRAAGRFNPMVPPQNLLPLRDRMAATRTTPLFQAMLIGAFALVAMLLAAAGLYGSLTHSVGRRQRELGVRMALGADRARVLRMVLSQGMRVSMAGLTLGMIATLFLARVLTSLLYGVEPNDPATLLMVGTVLVLVSAAACLAPARRATAVDLVTVLKAE